MELQHNSTSRATVFDVISFLAVTAIQAKRHCQAHWSRCTCLGKTGAAGLGMDLVEAARHADLTTWKASGVLPCGGCSVSGRRGRSRGARLTSSARMACPSSCVAGCAAAVMSSCALRRRSPFCPPPPPPAPLCAAGPGVCAAPAASSSAAPALLGDPVLLQG